MKSPVIRMNNFRMNNFPPKSDMFPANKLTFFIL